MLRIFCGHALRQLAEVALAKLMAFEVEDVVGVAKGKRTPERETYPGSYSRGRRKLSSPEAVRPPNPTALASKLCMQMPGGPSLNLGSVPQFP